MLLGGFLGLDLHFSSPIQSPVCVCSCPVDTLFQLLAGKQHFGKGRSAVTGGEIVGPQKAGSSAGSGNATAHFPAISCFDLSE